MNVNVLRVIFNFLLLLSVLNSIGYKTLIIIEKFTTDIFGSVAGISKVLVCLLCLFDCYWLWCWGSSIFTTIRFLQKNRTNLFWWNYDIWECFRLSSVLNYTCYCFGLEGPEMNYTNRCMVYSGIYLRKYTVTFTVCWLGWLTRLSSQLLFIVSGRVHVVTSWGISL